MIEIGTEFLQNNRQLADMAIADILSSRFLKVFRERKLDIDEYARGLKSSFWFVPNYQRRDYPDGTYDYTSLNRLRLFVEDTALFLPRRADLRVLESALGFRENEICTIFEENMTPELFLFGLGYLDTEGKPTRTLYRLPRVKAYQKKASEDEKAKRERLKATQQTMVEREKAQTESFYHRIRRLALGRWGESEEAA